MIFSHGRRELRLNHRIAGNQLLHLLFPNNFTPTQRS
jgi:hypothetical protein